MTVANPTFKNTLANIMALVIAFVVISFVIKKHDNYRTLFEFRKYFFGNFYKYFIKNFKNQV